MLMGKTERVRQDEGSVEEIGKVCREEKCSVKCRKILGATLQHSTIISLFHTVYQENNQICLTLYIQK